MQPADRSTPDRSPLVHGSNLRQKETNPAKYRDGASRTYLAEIRAAYDTWHTANMALQGPGATATPDDEELIKRRVELLEKYKNFIDQQRYAEQFDSRSNLHSSVLEEFQYYLFKDLVASFGPHALIGKSHTFKDIFFAAPSFSEMLLHPHAKIERKDHDFVIGTTIEAIFQSSTPPEQDESPGGQQLLFTEKPERHEEVKVTQNRETHLFDLPAVAIECKTYLDKTMLEGSSRAAEELKARNPNARYVVVAEWLKLSSDVNLQKYKVDQIYVLRKQKNTDREYRYLPGYVKNPIAPEVVWHLFNTVRTYLTSNWEGDLEYGIQRGWLI